MSYLKNKKINKNVYRFCNDFVSIMHRISIAIEFIHNRTFFLYRFRYKNISFWGKRFSKSFIVHTRLTLVEKSLRNLIEKLTKIVSLVMMFTIGAKRLLIFLIWRNLGRLYESPFFLLILLGFNPKKKKCFLMIFLLHIFFIMTTPFAEKSRFYPCLRYN